MAQLFFTKKRLVGTQFGFKQIEICTYLRSCHRARKHVREQHVILEVLQSVNIDHKRQDSSSYILMENMGVTVQRTMFERIILDNSS